MPVPTLPSAFTHPLSIAQNFFPFCPTFRIQIFVLSGALFLGLLVLRQGIVFCRHLFFFPCEVTRIFPPLFFWPFPFCFCVPRGSFIVSEYIPLSFPKTPRKYPPSFFGLADQTSEALPPFPSSTLPALCLNLVLCFSDLGFCHARFKPRYRTGRFIDWFFPLFDLPFVPAIFPFSDPENRTSSLQKKFPLASHHLFWRVSSFSASPLSRARTRSLFLSTLRFHPPSVPVVPFFSIKDFSSMLALVSPKSLFRSRGLSSSFTPISLFPFSPFPQGGREDPQSRTAHSFFRTRRIFRDHVF